MRKLRLDLDDLQVTSFETDARPEPSSGTVLGYHNQAVSDTQWNSCGETFCGGNTCEYTCRHGCYGTNDVGCAYATATIYAPCTNTCSVE